MLRPLITALLLLMMALAVPAGAQMSGPETVTFEIKQFDWKNERGTAFRQVVINNSRLDTLPEMSVRMILAGGDSTRAVFNVTVNRRGYPLYTEVDTFSLWQEMPVPLKSGLYYLPDSLYYVYANNVSPDIGAELRITLNPADPDQGYFLPIVFANDTVFGTTTDTSDVIDLGRGAKTAVFGFKGAVETAEVTYEMLYNLGEGWGYANPSDTLAGKTWTDDIAQNTWGFRDVGELLNSTFARVIRRGEAAADTAVCKQSLRLSPR